MSIISVSEENVTADPEKKNGKLKCIGFFLYLQSYDTPLALDSKPRFK